MKSRLLSSIAVSAIMMYSSFSEAATTLETIRSRGQLICGINPNLPGFSASSKPNEWVGLDIDICRALSSALFNSPDKVKYVPLDNSQRLVALKNGEIDVLSRNTTWTFSRDIDGVNYGPVVLYDGQGFMAPKRSGIKTTKDMEGATICFQTGTTTESNLNDFFKNNGMTYQGVPYQNYNEVVTGFFSGRCDVMSSDASQLASARSNSTSSDGYNILPTMISKEPLAPVVRHGDDQWFDIVKWTIYIMIEAEELGINSANVDQFSSNSKDPKVKRLLGTDSKTSSNFIGPNDRWAYYVIKQVGNYGEVFERNIGVKSPLHMERNLNALWNKGGLMYSPPYR